MFKRYKQRKEDISWDSLPKQFGRALTRDRFQKQVRMEFDVPVLNAGRWEGGETQKKSQGENGLSETACDSLAHPYRRHLLRYLTLNKYMVTVEDIAEEIAAQDQDKKRAAVTEDERKRVQLHLFHNHLPRLRDAGLVDYDEKSGMVALTEKARPAIETLNQL